MPNTLITIEWVRRMQAERLLAYLKDPMLQRLREEEARRVRLEPGYQLDLFEDAP